VVVATDRTRVNDIPQNVVFLPKPWRPCDLQAQLRWEGERRRAAE
jgi:hypothetical protein